MLDPKTGKVTNYRLPEPIKPTGLVEAEVDHYTDPPGIHPGMHGLFIDKNTGLVYSTGTWHRSIVRINPKTGEMKGVVTNLTQNGNMALHPDGKSIWRTDSGEIRKYDLPGVFETGMPSKTWKMKSTNNTYGNFISADGRYFGGGGGTIVWFDTQTEELREIPLPIGGQRGRGTFDAEGNIWSGAQKLTKYDPKTGAVTAVHASDTVLPLVLGAHGQERRPVVRPAAGRADRTVQSEDRPLDRVRAADAVELRLQLVHRQLHHAADLLVRRSTRIHRSRSTARIGRVFKG